MRSKLSIGYGVWRGRKFYLNWLKREGEKVGG